MTIDQLKTWLLEEIEKQIADIEEIRKSAGKDYDHSSYGAGYDEGALSSLKLTLAFIEVDGGE